jgi:DNA-binding response OmpR family regulator
MLPPHPHQIAFVETPGSSTSHLRQLLEFEGLLVTTFEPASLHRLSDMHADLVVVNQAGLRRSTFEVAVQARVSLSPRPLTLALVAKGDELTGIELVERGLDAFIATPCGSREFVARVRALLRRARWPDEDVAMSSANRPRRVSALDIDPLRRRVRVHGSDLRLTEQEFQLLYFLAGSPGRVFGREALLDAVWGSDTFVTTRSVDALVKRLRNQLRTAGGRERVVETVRGVGYRLAEDGVGASSWPA